MTLMMTHRRVAAFLLIAALRSGSAMAQVPPRSQGWPGAATAAPVSARAAAPASTPAVPAARRREPAVVATLPAPSRDLDLVAALHQQSDLLSRLALQIESDRTLIAEQGRLIASLQRRVDATPASPSLTATAPAALAAPAVAPAPARPAGAPPAMPVITVDTGGMKLRLSGLVQGWFTATTGAADTFRLRRTEVKLASDVNPRVRFELMLDPAKALSASNTYASINGQKVVADTGIGQGGRLLQDAFIVVKASPTLSVEVGQQKLPLTYQGTQSSTRLDTVDRALFITDKARGAGYGDIRDVGVTLRGRLMAGQIEYAAGFFDGLGEAMNDVDKDGQKPVVGRILLRPRVIKGLQAGTSFARATLRTDAPNRRDRHAFETLYTRGRFTGQAEFVTGHDGVTPRRGYYAQTMVRVNRALDGVFRADSWDPDTRTDATSTTVTERDWLSGVSWRVGGPGAIVQLNYVRKTFAGVQPSRDVFMANVQTVW